MAAAKGPNTTAAATVCGAAARGNTGLLCETDTPASPGVPAGDCTSPTSGVANTPPTDAGYTHTCTTASYDKFGQKTSQTSPAAHAAGSTASTTYSYYADTGSCTTGQDNCDLSATVSAGGWLKAVTDPAGKSVVNAYDHGGNAARTWDRNATNGIPLSAHWSSATNPPSTAYREIDHANPVTSAALSVSNYDTLVVQPAGTVAGSGSNGQGELGNNTTTSSSTPVQAIGLSNVVQVAQASTGAFGGTELSAALTASGSVYAWGSSVVVPTQVIGLPTIISISVGGGHILALDNVGSVWAWGVNAYGEVGNGSTTTVTTPVKVLSGVATIAAGGYHSLAVKTDGTVWAWGVNSAGELGLGTTTDQHTPTQIPNLSGVLAVSGGVVSSYAIKTDGTVWSWGDNTLGALGTGSTAASATTPQQITTLGGGTPAGAVRQILGSVYGAAALMSDGTVQAWGYNNVGQLGGATSAGSSATPLPVPNLTGQIAIAGGWATYLTADAAGHTTIWGLTSSAQIGDGTSPAEVAPQASAYTISPFAAPWRYTHATRDPVGNLTTNTTDADGNPLIITPPRGTAVLTTAFAATATYNANNQQLAALAPLERGEPARSTTTVYDSFGNPTVRVNARGYATLTDYDSLDRVTAVHTTRGSTAQSVGSGCTGSAGGTGWTQNQTGHTICTVSTTYDGTDHADTVTDATNQTARTTVDGLGRKTVVAVPRSATSTLSTRWNYDADGHVVDVCPPRQFDPAEPSSSGGCTSAGVYSTHTSYDNTGRVARQTRYRLDGATSIALNTDRSFDADGNPIRVTDPAGRATTTTYDLLDRKTSQTVPRSPGIGNTTTWNHDPSGNVISVYAPSSRAPAPPGSGSGPLVVDGSTAANSTDGQLHNQSNPFQIPLAAAYTDVTVQNGGWITAKPDATGDQSGLVFTATGTVSVCASCGITQSGHGQPGGTAATAPLGNTPGTAGADTTSGGNGGGGGLGTLSGAGSGGGGGGHAAAGSDAASGAPAGGLAGARSGTNDFTDVGTTYLLGSGGGGGGGGQGLTATAAGNGGNGGGFVHISATTITVAAGGVITASGQPGGNASGSVGGGGGGAGGGIWLAANTISLPAAGGTTVAGGSGGTADSARTGGAGAPGYVRLDADTITNPGGALTGRSSNITAYSYDADNRLLDTVTGAQLDPAIASQDAGAAGAPDPHGLFNTRTRVVYDADGHTVATLPPQAFTDTASLTAPNSDTAARVDYDLNGRPNASYDPRYNGSVPDTGTGNDAGTGGNQQTSECPTGAAASAVPGLPPYSSDVGVCVTRSRYDEVGNLTKRLLPSSALDSAGDSVRYLAATYTDDNLPAATQTPDPTAGTGTGVPATTQHTYVFDGNRRPVQDTDGTGKQTVTSYTADGLPTQTQSTGYTLGSATITHTTTTTYDANGEPISTSQPQAAAPASGLHAADYTTTTTWTSDGLRNTNTAPGLGSNDFDISRYTYDKVGNPITVTSPSAVTGDHKNTDGTPDNRGTVNTFTDDNMINTSSVPITDNLWRTTSYAYTPYGQKSAVRIGRCTSTTETQCRLGNPALDNGALTQYTYAANGLNVDQIGKNNSAITTSYDQAARPVALSAPADPTDSGNPTQRVTVTASYYLDAMLRTAADGRNTNTYAYNGLGQPTVRSDHTASNGVTGGDTIVTSYAYNNAALPTAMTSGVNADNTTTYGYLAGGLLHTATDSGGSSNGSAGQQQSFVYNPDNSLATATTRIAGATSDTAAYAYRYDNNTSITSQTITGTAYPATLTNAYSYNPARNITGYTHTVAGGPAGNGTYTTSYTWDHNANRLTANTAAPNGTTNDTWTYRSDNSIATQNHTSTGDPTTNANRTYHYDDAGRLTSDECSTYTYDDFDRISQDTHTDSAICGKQGSTTTYNYDGLDRQRSAQVSNATKNNTLTPAANGITTTAFDGPGSSIIGQTGAVTGDNSKPTVLYQLDPTGHHTAIRQTNSNTSHTDLTNADGQGNISLTINNTTNGNATGTPGCAAAYDPFGNPEPGPTPPANGNGVCASGPEAATTGNAAWYNDQKRDATTGNYQLGTRTYNPTTATFTTPDQHRGSTPNTDLGVGTDPLTANTYTYVNGNPLNFTDTNGHVPCNKLPTGDRVGCEIRSTADQQYCLTAPTAERCGSPSSAPAPLPWRAQEGVVRSDQAPTCGIRCLAAPFQEPLKFVAAGVAATATLAGCSAITAGVGDVTGVCEGVSYAAGGATYGYLDGCRAAKCTIINAAAGLVGGKLLNKVARKGVPYLRRILGGEARTARPPTTEATSPQPGDNPGNSPGAPAAAPPRSGGMPHPAADTVGPDLSQGYNSFRAAKRALPDPGAGNVYDHVVEQSQIGRSGFDPREIHNPYNLDPVPAAVNQAKANYYSSIRPFTGGVTVRDWLTGQSFADQYSFGMQITGQIQRGAGLP